MLTSVFDFDRLVDFNPIPHGHGPCVIFEGTVQKKLCQDKWHEILIGTIRQVRNAKKFEIPTIEI